MGNQSASKAGPDLAELFEPGPISGDDRTLLDRFGRDGSASAFEGLLSRHGGLVRGVCRRVLGNQPDADDAFQATFLVLARRAGAIRDPDRLAPWLHGVATRVALKARAQRARRREVAVDPTRFERTERTQGGSDLGETQAIVAAELARVPGKLRDAVVVCLVEGATVEEAATRLACPVGTVKSRLARGRAALQTRLIRRGLAPGLAAAPFAAADAVALASSPVPLPLIRATLALVLAPAASIAPAVADLTHGATPTMLTKFAAATAVILGGFALVATPQDPSAPPQGQPAPTVAKETPVGAASVPPRDPIALANMQRIAEAFCKYRDVHGAYPTAVQWTETPKGNVPVSWRVLLLPFLGETPLYNEYHFDEPWFGPSNQKLNARMPAVYQTPGFPAPEGETHFLGFVGSETVLGAASPVGKEQVQDGPDKTALFGIARRAVTWMDPIDLPFAPNGVPPYLDRSDNEDHPIGMADGSIRWVPAADHVLLNAAVTHSRGEVSTASGRLLRNPLPGDIALGAVRGEAGGDPNNTFTITAVTEGHPGKTPAVLEEPKSNLPTPPPMPDFDQRLRRLEEKLDRLIERIETNSNAPRPTPPRQ